MGRISITSRIDWVEPLYGTSVDYVPVISEKMSAPLPLMRPCHALAGCRVLSGFFGNRQTT